MGGSGRRGEFRDGDRSEADGEDGFVFRYRATVKTFTGGPEGTDQPFAEKTVTGEIPRSWI
jgi:hypothetical protein